MTEVARDLARASTMLDVKRYHEAASLLARIVAAEPQDSRAWCLLAGAQLGTGHYQQAAAAAHRAVTLAPSDDWPYRLASTAEVHIGNIAAAVCAANEACRLAPNGYRSWLCMAQAALATEVDFDIAEQAAGNARRLAPDEPDVHFVSGKVSFARGEWKAARAHQERALALDLAHGGALNELGRIRLRRPGSAPAARHFLQAARSDPGIGVYGRNVEVTVRRVVARVIYAASVASLALAYVTMMTHLARVPVVTGFAVIAVLSAGFGAVQLRRMPPETRPLFQTRRTALALSVAYGPILVALIVTAVTPASALPAALLAVAALIVASRFLAYAILRHKKSSGGLTPRA